MTLFRHRSVIWVANPIAKLASKNQLPDVTFWLILVQDCVLPYDIPVILPIFVAEAVAYTPALP